MAVRPAEAARHEGKFVSWLDRLRARWRIVRNHGDELNRRVEVENVLLNVAAGKRPMLTKDECRSLAYRLGVPSSFGKT